MQGVKERRLQLTNVTLQGEAIEDKTADLSAVFMANDTSMVFRVDWIFLLF